nr:probable diaminopimelate decarboxylase, chloroplastic [Tanacetum cinerariifolium]
LSPFVDALDRLLDLVDRLGDCGIQLRHLDLGGGLGVRYRDEEPPLAGDYIKAVRERLEGRDLALMFEPGRFIVANAGVLLTRIEYLKHTEHKDFAIVDAAMNDLIRPALYQAWMDVTAVQPRDGAARVYDIVGPICETGDFLAKERELALAEGDLLAVHSAGAYGFVMSSNYNTRGRTAEVLVDGDQAFEVRRRETIRVETKGGIIELDVRNDGQISVNMGAPRLVPADIPFDAPQQAISYTLEVDTETVELAAVSMGNPHAVLRVYDINNAPVHTLGPKIENHPRFPARVNVGFLHVVDRQRAQLRVGETQACGTGACAAAVAAISQGWMESPLLIDLPGGRLSIEWAGPGHPPQTSTDTPSESPADNAVPALEAEAVAAWLQQHPDFFAEHDDLLTAMRIPHQRGDTVSLVERQLKILRERNIEMRHRLSQLMDVARDNDRLFEKTRRLI